MNRERRTNTSITETTPASHIDRPLNYWSAALTTLTAALWAGTAVGTRIAADTVSPMLLGALRFGWTLPVLWMWCRWQQSRLQLAAHDCLPIGVLGLLLFVQICTFNIGISWSNGSHASVIINTYLFWVAGYEHFVTRTHRLRVLQMLGLLVAFGGVMLLFEQTSQGGAATGQQDPPSLAGDLMLLVSSLLLAAKVCYTKHAVRKVEPGPLIFWHNVVGTILFAVGGLLLEDVSQTRLPTNSVLALLYIGPVVSGFCFAAHAWLLSRHSAGAISVFSFLTPVVGVLFANLLRGDQLTSGLLLCGLCVAAGIALVNWPEAKHDAPLNT